PGDRLHVDRERPDPRRHRREGHAARRGDQRRLLDPDRADRDRHLPLQDPRALRDGGHRPPARASRGTPMSDPGAIAVFAILLIPVAGAAVLALLPDDRTTAWLNVLASATTFGVALVLLVRRPE